MRLCDLLPFIDATEIVRVTDYSTRRAMYAGLKIFCPSMQNAVIGIWTANGEIIIEISQ